jgi:hypothetical protein
MFGLVRNTAIHSQKTMPGMMETLAVVSQEPWMSMHKRLMIYILILSCLFLNIADCSSKVSLSEGQNSFDIRFLLQPRKANPSLWIRPFYFLQVAYFGTLI